MDSKLAPYFKARPYLAELSRIHREGLEKYLLQGLVDLFHSDIQQARAFIERPQDTESQAFVEYLQDPELQEHHYWTYQATAYTQTFHDGNKQAAWDRMEDLLDDRKIQKRGVPRDCIHGPFCPTHVTTDAPSSALPAGIPMRLLSGKALSRDGALPFLDAEDWVTGVTDPWYLMDSEVELLNGDNCKFVPTHRLLQDYSPLSKGDLVNMVNPFAQEVAYVYTEQDYQGLLRESPLVMPTSYLERLERESHE